jgi:hypothetical protein
MVEAVSVTASRVVVDPTAGALTALTGVLVDVLVDVLDGVLVEAGEPVEQLVSVSVSSPMVANRDTRAIPPGYATPVRRLVDRNQR